MDGKTTSLLCRAHSNRDKWELKENVPGVAACKEVNYQSIDELETQLSDGTTVNDGDEVIGDSECTVSEGAGMQDYYFAPSNNEYLFDLYHPEHHHHTQQQIYDAAPTVLAYEDSQSKEKNEGIVIQDSGITFLVQESESADDVVVVNRQIIVEEHNAIRTWHQMNKHHLEEQELLELRELRKQKQQQQQPILQQYTCQYCKEQVSCYFSEKHIKVCGPYHCEPCKRRFACENDLLRHEETQIHKTKSGIKFSKSHYSGKIECQFCHRTLSAEYFPGHVCYDKEMKIYHCTRCGEKLLSLTAHQLHICDAGKAKHYQHQKPVTCEFCNEHFRTSLYKKHMEVCGPYRCEPCDRRYPKESELLLHEASLLHQKKMVILTPNSAFTCLCGKVFKKYQFYRKHAWRCAIAIAKRKHLAEMGEGLKGKEKTQHDRHHVKENLSGISSCEDDHVEERREVIALGDNDATILMHESGKAEQGKQQHQQEQREQRKQQESQQFQQQQQPYLQQQQQQQCEQEQQDQQQQEQHKTLLKHDKNIDLMIQNNRICKICGIIFNRSWKRYRTHTKGCKVLEANRKRSLEKSNFVEGKDDAGPELGGSSSENYQYKNSREVIVTQMHESGEQQEQQEQQQRKQHQQHQQKQQEPQSRQQQQQCLQQQQQFHQEQQDKQQQEQHKASLKHKNILIKNRTCKRCGKMFSSGTKRYNKHIRVCILLEVNRKQSLDKSNLVEGKDDTGQESGVSSCENTQYKDSREVIVRQDNDIAILQQRPSQQQEHQEQKQLDESLVHEKNIDISKQKHVTCKICGKLFMFGIGFSKARYSKHVKACQLKNCKMNRKRSLEKLDPVDGKDDTGHEVDGSSCEKDQDKDSREVVVTQMHESGEQQEQQKQQQQQQQQQELQSQQQEELQSQQQQQQCLEQQQQFHQEQQDQQQQEQRKSSPKHNKNIGVLIQNRTCKICGKMFTPGKRYSKHIRVCRMLEMNKKQSLEKINLVEGKDDTGQESGVSSCENDQYKDSREVMVRQDNDISILQQRPSQQQEHQEQKQLDESFVHEKNIDISKQKHVTCKICGKLFMFGIGFSKARYSKHVKACQLKNGKMNRKRSLEKLDPVDGKDDTGHEVDGSSCEKYQDKDSREVVVTQMHESGEQQEQQEQQQQQQQGRQSQQQQELQSQQQQQQCLEQQQQFHQEQQDQQQQEQRKSSLKHDKNIGVLIQNRTCKICGKMFTPGKRYSKHIRVCRMLEMNKKQSLEKINLVEGKDDTGQESGVSSCENDQYKDSREVIVVQDNDITVLKHESGGKQRQEGEQQQRRQHLQLQQQRQQLQQHQQLQQQQQQQHWDRV